MHHRKVNLPILPFNYRHHPFLSKLREKRIGVYFMEQGVDSLSDMSQMVIDVLETIAKMESTSISQNAKCGFDDKNEVG